MKCMAEKKKLYDFNKEYVSRIMFWNSSIFSAESAIQQQQ